MSLRCCHGGDYRMNYLSSQLLTSNCLGIWMGCVLSPRAQSAAVSVWRGPRTVTNPLIPPSSHRNSGGDTVLEPSRPKFHTAPIHRRPLATIPHLAPPRRGPPRSIPDPGERPGRLATRRRLSGSRPRGSARRGGRRHVRRPRPPLGQQLSTQRGRRHHRCSGAPQGRAPRSADAGSTRRQERNGASHDEDTGWECWDDPSDENRAPRQ